MMKIAIGTVAMMVFAIQALAPASLPGGLTGEWRIGAPYNTPAPIGIDEHQEKLIRAANIRYSPGALIVCDTHIVIKKTDIRSRPPEDFLQAYGFLPRLLGLEGETIVDLTINPFDPVKACGNSEGSVGTHLLIGKNGHVVMEVANAYFSLIRRNSRN